MRMRVTLEISTFSVWAFGHIHKADDWRNTWYPDLGVRVPEPYQFMENWLPSHSQ